MKRHGQFQQSKHQQDDEWGPSLNKPCVITVGPDGSVYVATGVGTLFHYAPDMTLVNSTVIPGSREALRQEREAAHTAAAERLRQQQEAYQAKWRAEREVVLNAEREMTRAVATRFPDAIARLTAAHATVKANYLPLCKNPSMRGSLGALRKNPTYHRLDLLESSLSNVIMVVDNLVRRVNTETGRGIVASDLLPAYDMIVQDRAAVIEAINTADETCANTPSPYLVIE